MSARPNQSKNLIPSPTDRVVPIAINFSQRGSDDENLIEDTDEANLTLSSANFESPDDKQATMKPNKQTHGLSFLIGAASGSADKSDYYKSAPVPKK